MSTLEQRLAKLRSFNAAVHRGDTGLAEESADLRPAELREVERPPQAVEHAIEMESIALRRTRPVLAIRDDVAQLVFVDSADSRIWEERLRQAEPLLVRASRAVGRIELQGSSFDWVGTGWLVAENILVTNRHVAAEFAHRRGQGFGFRPGTSGPMAAAVDFKQEIDNPATLLFRLVKPIHIEDAPGPDVAFFEIDLRSGDARLAMPIELAARPGATRSVATIGYPAYDSRIPEPELMETIFGRIYNKKRLAPGGVTRLEATRLLHDCTTLGGNSGSVVFDLESGQALGLHFSGSFLATNYAVRSDVVKELLDRARCGRPPAPPRPPAPVRPPAESPRPRLPAVGFGIGIGIGGCSATVTIPLTVTLSFGAAPAPGIATASSPVASGPAQDSADLDEDNEAIAADYADRDGYAAAFLGLDFVVELPAVERDSADVLQIDAEGGPGTELRYQHFSVVMSRSRRMCFFSAANIDGGQSRKTRRVGWKWDPRLPKSQQIMRECYGDPPRFSRGHMTRREDPAWGDALSARRGNEDSMHVTNATPQMQAFNSPIWLALEDYALEHAREDDMKISVFTGPYFDARDPIRYGVLIPTAFWKIIAFVHDVTGELCATGYEMDQSQNLRPEEEFVFGGFDSPHLGVATQVSIASIEARSGLRFGGLAARDPMAGGDESASGGSGRTDLTMLEQIRFVR